jgi:hypothetical protein
MFGFALGSKSPRERCRIRIMDDRQSCGFPRPSRMTIEDPRPNLEASAIKGSESKLDEAVRQTREHVLGSLPNDLIRLIYLASIRDYNSGSYLHSVLSRQYAVDVADQAFKICHQEVFARLLQTAVSNYVQQLNEYIRYSRSDRAVLITTWKSLQAYRSAIPSHAAVLSADLFSLNVKTALAILQAGNE